MVSRTQTIDVDDSQKLLIGALVLVVISVACGSFVFLSSLDSSYGTPYLFLIPWIFGLAVILVIPSAILYLTGNFSLADPLIFATWSYFFPAFVVGGVMLSMGWSQPYFLDHIQDPEVDLPYTVFLVGLGFAGLSLGYFLPTGAYFGKVISGILPKTDLSPSAYILPGLFLLGLGMVSFVAALVIGVAGYQGVEMVNSYDGLIIATTQFWMEAIFMLLFIVFKKDRFDAASATVIAIVSITFLARALYMGNRGSLLQLFVVCLLAYVLAGRELKLKQAAVGSVALVLCIVVGIIYGTTFRLTKGGEGTVSMSEYTDNIFRTFEQVGRTDGQELVEFASSTMAERLDTLSSVAVVVSNYEKLEPYEEQYGLKDNIINDLTTFFIPRVIWNDKPVASDARNYSDLYFDYRLNSFAITSIGDLLRNFGPIGVLVGMLVLGLILRTLYTATIDVGSVITWKAAIYYVLLITVSYESFYASIIPNLVKHGLVATVGMTLVVLFSRWVSRSNTSAQGLILN
jgi:hypothetical protein